MKGRQKMKVRKKRQANQDKRKNYIIRRSNAGVGFFAIAREERMQRLQKEKDKKAEISARK